MKGFWKNVLATITGMVILCVIQFIFLIVIVGSLASITKEKMPVVKPNSVLYMNLDKTIYDKAPSDFMSIFNYSFENDQPVGLNTILNSIEKAKTDNCIKGILIETSSVSAGYALTEEIREALENFKQESGKFIVAYSKSLTQTGYYLVSVADRIILNSEGSLTFRGLSAGTVFYKNMLNKLDIDVRVFRPQGNKFKSAVEPFISDKMSDANKEQSLRIATSVWNTMVAAIGNSRNISKEKINNIADDLKIKTADDAMAYGFIDQTGYIDDAYSYINQALGFEKSKKVEQINIKSYGKLPLKKEITTNKIAVIYAIGEIIDGKGSDIKIGDESLCKQIKKARLDKSVKAIVFRVNSPGGSALASEIILHEIMLAKEVKPVIASYGTYAASGGYYISCMSDWIVCDKSTLTGSIGVFGMIPDVHKLLNNKLGITTDFVSTNKYALNPSILYPLSEGDIEYLNSMVNTTYQTFLKHVATGRSMSIDAVDEIAQGRVWTGEDAIKIGLVDEIGGLKRAIAIAAEKANLTEYKIISLPKEKNSYEQIMELINSDDVSETKLAKKLGIFYPVYQTLKEINEMSGVQARIPYKIEIR